jgi:hypothetical protein
MLEGLMRLWMSLSYSAGEGRRLAPGDLDFIVTPSKLRDSYAERLRQLSEHIWSTQEKCIKGWKRAQAKGF